VKPTISVVQSTSLTDSLKFEFKINKT